MIAFCSGGLVFPYPGPQKKVVDQSPLAVHRLLHKDHELAEALLGSQGKGSIDDCILIAIVKVSGEGGILDQLVSGKLS